MTSREGWDRADLANPEFGIHRCFGQERFRRDPVSKTAVRKGRHSGSPKAGTRPAPTGADGEYEMKPGPDAPKRC